MARLHTQATATDPFTSLSSGQELSASGNWARRLQSAAGVVYEESPTLTRILGNWFGNNGRVIYSYTATAPGSADHSVGMTYNGSANTTNPFYVGPACRTQTNGNCYTALFYNNPGGDEKIQLYRYAGSATKLAETSAATTLLDGEELIIEAWTNGSGHVELKVYVDDAEETDLAFTDSAGNKITTAGEGGCYAFLSGGDSYPYWLDWTLYEAATGIGDVFGRVGGTTGSSIILPGRN